jgi:hypothetical protein
MRLWTVVCFAVAVLLLVLAAFRVAVDIGDRTLNLFDLAAASALLGCMALPGRPRHGQ